MFKLFFVFLNIFNLQDYAKMMQNKCFNKDQTQNYLPQNKNKKIKNWSGAFCTFKGTDQKDFLSWSDPKKIV